MKIKVKLGVSESGKTKTFEPRDLCNSEEEWVKLSENEKYELVRNAVNEMEQPYWYIDSINE